MLADIPSIKCRHLTVAFALLGALNISASTRAQPQTQHASVVPLKVSLQRFEGQSRRHFTERCSAFFVGHDDREAVLMSAWHCIDGELSFQHQPSVSVQGKRVAVTIMDSGNGMDRDWLVMKAPSTAFSSLIPIELSRRPVVDDESLVAIGWGRQTDPSNIKPSAVECSVISADKSLTLDCGLTKGDSGGVVARQLENGHLEAVGIISSGDSASLSFAFPLWRLPDLFD